MYWADGSSFEGIWKDDMRYEGKMIMSNGCIYEGTFKNDKFHCKMAKLFLPSMVIYEGEFKNGKTRPIAKLLYPLGDIYYGQIQQFERHGLGKHIFFDGSYYEGTWVNDKMHGDKCKLFNASSSEVYIGSFANNKKQGSGKHYDPEQDEIYEGDFTNDKRDGDGTLVKRDGRIYKVFFRNNYLEN